VDQYGKKAWELDAMNPNELRDTVREQIEEYIDPDDSKQHQKIEKEKQKTTQKIGDAMAEAGAK
jgi:hypothetical protein